MSRHICGGECLVGDVPDMNVGDMVNECTSGVNASYTTHVTDTVIPYMIRYYNFDIGLYY
jgi:hypothetical protein